MADVFSKQYRSQLMAKIRSKDTKLEMKVRSGLHKMGFRYRLHVNQLPGKPDIVLPKYKAVIQIRGCFWHDHGCKKSRKPKSRQNYWIPKIEKNKKRDHENDAKLRKMGWSVLTIWECRCSSIRSLNTELLRIERLLLKRKEDIAIQQKKLTKF